jgi:hypothetical protein
VNGPPKPSIVTALLARHGRTYAAEAGIRLARNTPAPLFQLLCLSVLLSARIRADSAIAAAKGLRAAGWTTPDRMAVSTWSQRTKVLNRAGYARYDERTSRMLGDDITILRERYRGDLRRMRDEAGHDPATERWLLQDFKGIGAVGASIFAREVQLVWGEQYPYADDRALESARRLGLGDDAPSLVRLTDGVAQFTTLVAALVRCRLQGDHDEVLAAAS